MVERNHVIITGPVNSGKTTLLYALNSRLDSLGKSIGGISQVMPLPHKIKTDWVWSDQGSGETQVLMSTEQHDDWKIFKRFWYNQSTFDWASALLLKHRSQYEVLTVDEIGPIELSGGGLHDAYSTILHTYNGLLITVVRDNLLEEVLSYFGINKDDVLLIHSQKEKESELRKVVPVE